MVGELNKDFVHHCYLKMFEKTDFSKIRNADTYFYTIMRSELKQFLKDHNKQYFTDSLEREAYERTDHIESELIRLQQEGYIEEVFVFNKLIEGDTINQLSKKIDVSNVTIKKMFIFVRNKLKRVYDNYDTIAIH